ncbi:MAG TPA: Clp1/GlmU family protein [Candidatus Bathyarchaeia archaeon]|nr:Clp1/GlmU family protein [Candidatus Bathyarchaeia archaeon]
MNRTVERGKTLLVDGAASVLVVSGKVEVFGFSVKDAGRIVIREGKRLPFAVLETANFDISLGENASIEEVDGNTIPLSWIESFEMLKAFQKKPVTAMVLGKVDSGKTSFCTYLINRLVSEKQKVALLDGDLGQSDIGPPCTVAYAFVTKPVTDLFRLRAENAFFVGVTSPSEAVNKTIKGIALMKAEIVDKAADFVVMNTDGWVEGEEAVKYKSRLAEELNPDVIFCIQQKDELAPLLVALEKFMKTTIDYPLTAKQRSREKRRNLRELGYIKYLTDAKVKSLSLKLLAIEEQSVGLIRQGEEGGVLLGLYDSQRKFLGIGILCKVDYVRKTLKVLTSISEKPSSISLGKVRLDKNLKEIPLSLEETATATQAKV